MIKEPQLEDPISDGDQVRSVITNFESEFVEFCSPLYLPSVRLKSLQ